MLNCRLVLLEYLSQKAKEKAKLACKINPLLPLNCGMMRLRDMQLIL